MQVFKYCKSEFNPLCGCPTLKLGTTLYFREKYEQGGNFIFDGQEGIGQFKIQGSEMSDIKGCPDGYIFCAVDRSLTMEDVHRDFDSSYDDCYSINDYSAFYQEVLTLVANKIADSPLNVGNSYVSGRSIKFITNGQVAIDSFRRHVDYSKGAETKFGTIGTDELIFLSHFHKPSQYMNQHEHRLLFLQVKDGCYYDPGNSDAVFIDCKTLLKFIESC
jgi:hypothetical protein